MERLLLLPSVKVRSTAIISTETFNRSQTPPTRTTLLMSLAQVSRTLQKLQSVCHVRLQFIFQLIKISGSPTITERLLTEELLSLFGVVVVSEHLVENKIQ